MSSPWKGPFIVVKKLNDVTYMIQKSARAQPFASHIDTLKEYEGENKPTWYKPNANQTRVINDVN